VYVSCLGWKKRGRVDRKELTSRIAFYSKTKGGKSGTKVVAVFQDSAVKNHRGGGRGGHRGGGGGGHLLARGIRSRKLETTEKWGEGRSRKQRLKKGGMPKVQWGGGGGFFVYRGRCEKKNLERKERNLNAREQRGEKEEPQGT